VINARFIKPLDEGLLEGAICGAQAIITIEESALTGGFGSAILELYERLGLNTPLRCLGIPDRFLPHGSVEGLHRTCGIDVEGILAAYDSLSTTRRVLKLEK